MKRWTVYCHTHTESGRRYVGLTSRTMNRRWAQHCCQARSAKGGRWHFPNAIRKYGPEAFAHDIIGVYDTLEEANQKERDKIEEWDLRNPEKGFNLAKGGTGADISHSIRNNPWDRPEYRAKQSVRLSVLQTPKSRFNNKAALNTPESREKRALRSKEIMSRPGMREKLSILSKGRRLTSEQKIKISLVMKTRSPELVARITQKLRGRTHDPELVAKIAAKLRGRVLSSEAKEKISARFKGKPLSQEHRSKLASINKGKSNPKASQKLRRYITDDNGEITHKICHVHGVISVDDCWVGRCRNKPRIICKECVRGRSSGHLSRDRRLR